MKKWLSFVLSLGIIIFCLTGCKAEKASKPKPAKFDIKASYPDAKIINLNGSTATVDGVTAEEFDYTWHCDPSISHDEVENAPAEYYTGQKPETDAAVYIDSDLNYYPLLDESGFKLQNYDGEKEWCYYYPDGKHEDYIFATLPALGNSLPDDMMFSAEEAAKNRVLHITQPGVYALSGEWNGQVLVDLGDGDENFADENAKITVILNGVDITCTVAPAIVFCDAYECDNLWEERDSHSAEVDTSDAGVNVVIADDTTNNTSGKNIYRMLKTTYKDEDSDDAIKVQKKLRKIDAAFYSYQSMTITGGGKLNITSSFEGLDSELHLSINDGNITINSQDDGINVNEDNVSVLCINGGTVTLNAALGAEGDGIDSNGFVCLNKGTLNINGVTAPDSAIDSEDGITYNGGKVVIDGREQEYSTGSTFRETGGMGGFGDKGEFGNKNFGGKNEIFNDADFDLQKFKQAVAELPEDATLQDVLELLGINNFKSERPDDMGQPSEDMQEPPTKPNN